MSKSKVFLVRGARGESPERLDVIAKALYDRVNPEHQMVDSVVLKVHVGEIGNDGTDLKSHMRPEWVRAFVNPVRSDGASQIFAADSTPTYVFGERSTVAGHKKVAELHGFTSERMGIQFSVADESGTQVIPNQRLNGIHIPELFHNVGKSGGYAVVLSHFTGHELYAFGGALKNLGMGFVGKDTKAAIHHFKAVVDQDKCLGDVCGKCIEVCAHDAISYVSKPGEEGKQVAYATQADCYGCMGCLRDCESGAMGLDFGKLGDISTPKGKKEVGEYVTDSLIIAANEVTKVFEPGHMLFVTDLTEITGFCDCDSPVLHDHGPISLAKDIGYLASTDPVALDKACIELVQQHTTPDEWHELCGVKPFYFPIALTQQIDKAVELKMGNKQYDLIQVSLPPS